MARVTMWASALLTVVVAVGIVIRGRSAAPAPHGEGDGPQGVAAQIVPAREDFVLTPRPSTLFRAVDPPALAATTIKQSVPIRLTASDGTGLRLAALEANAVIVDPLAFTEIHLRFENPLDRTLEGRFAITLPERASVSRFAMKQGAEWHEGEVVERKQARAAYEDFLHRRQDPALLEQGAGNEFNARVFPIPARGTKEIIVAYSEELVGEAPYVLSLRGLAELGRLDVQVSTGKGEPPLYQMHETSFVPRSDVYMTRSGTERAGGLRADGLVLARVRPMGQVEVAPLDATVVLFDTSASRALGFADNLQLLEGLVGQIAKAAPEAALSVAAFDQGVQSVFRGAASAFGAREIDRLRAIDALGASDLGRALRWAADEAKATHARRVVLVGDGVATAGETDGGRLRDLARRLGGVGVGRIDAVALGTLRDEALLRQIVTAGLASDGVVLEGASGAAELTRRLRLATRSGLTVNVEGASWFWPRTLDGVQPGDEALVYAELPSGVRPRLSIDGKAVTLPELSWVERPLLERAWARAKIASLAERAGTEGAAEQTKPQIVRLSTTYRVLSPYTSLLVLETEQDYARFGIDRRALSDILVVEGGRLALMKRAGKAMEVAKGETAGASPIAKPRMGADAPKAAVAPNAVPPPPHEASASAMAPAGRLAPAADPAPMGGQGTGVAAPMVEAKPTEERVPGALGAAAAAQGAPPHADEGTVDRKSALESAAVSPPPSPTAAPGAVGRAKAPMAASNGPGLAGMTEPRGSGGAVPHSAERATAAAGGSLLRQIARPDAALARPVPSSGNPALETLATPYTGRFAAVKEALVHRAPNEALATAAAWHRDDPRDVLALVALGEALEATGDTPRAARAYGAIIDLYAARADLRRFAGERLEHLAGGTGLDLALDTYEKAAADRPDHPASHRLLAFARLKKGDYEGAFDALTIGLRQRYPAGRFEGATRILREDLGLVAAAWQAASPARAGEIRTRLHEAGGAVEAAPSLRFVLNWETDANDVDFHIHDSQGGHAYYQNPVLPSGGSLYADVTTGYGPECFTIRLPAAQRLSYTLKAHYYARGPMGYGMGKLEIIDHDGKGHLRFEERPFVVMVDHAFVDLGRVARGLAGP